MSVTTLDETRPKARKVHQCDGCLGRIAAGDTYVQQKNVDNGDLWTYRSHLLCWEISSDLYGAYYGDDEWPGPDAVREVLDRIFAALAAEETRPA